MPVDLLGIGSIASGVGGLIGGFSGSSAAKKGRKEAKRQFNIQMNESIQRRVADARAAGIHPLFALGASVGASPTMHAGGSSRGGGIGEGLAEIGRAASGYAKGKQAAAIAGAQIRSAEAQATRDEAEAQLALSRAKRLEAELAGPRGHDGAVIGPGPEMYGPHTVVKPQVPATMPGNDAVAAGVSPLYKRTYTGSGRTADIINPDVAESDLMSDVILGGQLAYNKFASTLDRARGIMRVRDKHGNWHSYRQAPRRRRRRSKGSKQTFRGRRGRNR